MEKLELEVYTIKEKKPEDGAECWVCPVDSYPQMLCYNEEYKCWDDASGDDYERDLNDDDKWMELPKI